MRGNTEWCADFSAAPLQAVKEASCPAGCLIGEVVHEVSEDSFPASDPPGWIWWNESQPMD